MIVEATRLVGQVGIAGNERVVGRPNRVKCPVVARRAQYFQRCQWHFEREVSVFDPDAVRDRKRRGGQHAVERGVRGIQGKISNVEEQPDAKDS